MCAFELEPIVSCAFSTFVCERNKDGYYGTDSFRTQRSLLTAEIFVSTCLPILIHVGRREKELD